MIRSHWIRRLNNEIKKYNTFIQNPTIKLTLYIKGDEIIQHSYSDGIINEDIYFWENELIEEQAIPSTS